MKISILFPYRNAGATLAEAVESILAQTFREFELLAIDDHSEDNSAAILDRYQDPRIRRLGNPGRGLVAALNHGLSRAQGEWIARMDADDIMHPEKLQRQWRYLLENPAVDILACRSRLFPESEITDGFREYMHWQNQVLNHQDFLDQRYVEMPLTNPTALFRREMAQSLGPYRVGHVPEDYEFWLRAADAGYHFAKLPETLFDWRESPSRYTRTAKACSREAFDRVRAEYLAKDERLQQGRPLAYWGAGRRTRKRAQYLIEQGFPPAVWIDIDPRKIGNRIDGAWVRPDDWLTRPHAQKPFVLVYVANHGARDLIGDWLAGHGYRLGEDYLAVG